MELIIAILLSLGVSFGPTHNTSQIGDGDEITAADKRNVDTPIGGVIVVPDPREF